jgi:hypothetical protein
MMSMYARDNYMGSQSQVFEHYLSSALQSDQYRTRQNVPWFTYLLLDMCY